MQISTNYYLANFKINSKQQNVSNPQFKAAVNIQTEKAVVGSVMAGAAMAAAILARPMHEAMKQQLLYAPENDFANKSAQESAEVFKNSFSEREKIAEIFETGTAEDIEKVIDTKDIEYFTKLDFTEPSHSLLQRAFMKNKNPDAVEVLINKFGDAIFDSYMSEDDGSLSKLKKRFNDEEKDSDEYCERNIFLETLFTRSPLQFFMFENSSSEVTDKLIEKFGVNRFEEYWWRNPVVLKALLDSGKDVSNYSLLNVKDDPALVKILIEAGADVNEVSIMHLTTALHYNNSPEAVKLLINAGANIYAKDDQGRIPLYTVVNQEVIDILLDKETDKSKVFEYYKTPLHRATDTNKISKMLKMGADVNQKDNNGKTPLHTVINPICADMLIKAGADVNAIDNKGRTPADTAINEEIREIILKAGGTRKVYDVADTEPEELDEAKVEEFKKSIIESGIDINAKDSYGRTRLYDATDINEVKALIDLGVDVNSRTKSGNSCLSERGCSLSKMKLLLKAGANPDYMDLYCGGDSALTFACQEYNIPKVKLLLDNGADPYLFRSHHGVFEGNSEILKLLIEAGLDVNKVRKDYRNMSAFQMFIFDNKRDNPSDRAIQIAKVMIKAGADLSEFEHISVEKGFGMDIKPTTKTYTYNIKPMETAVIQEALKQIETEKAQ